MTSYPYTDILWHGASWYPELWPEQVDADLGKMAELGLNCLRLGDSIWGVLEPSDGVFSFDWYSGVLDRVHAAGIKFILTTPTYTPPRWMMRDYPDIARIDKDGLPFQHGSRGHASYTSANYLRMAERIAGKMAERFGNHPGLLAWQIDNEVSCHVDGDFSPATLTAWHVWLERRFGTIGELNRRWGTRVWDQYYNAFDEVQMPGKTPYGHSPGTCDGQHNPSLMVAWGEFLSDTTVAFVRLQADAIRRHSVAPITHNQIQLERTCPADLFSSLDLASTDSYWWPGTAHHHHRSIAWMRGLKRHADGSPKPFWLLETTPFQIGGLAPGPLKVAGFQRAEAALFTGGGATAHLYWLWRQQRNGVESSHGAILTAWGTPSPAWNEIKSVSSFLKSAVPLLAGIPPATPDIALHDPKLSKQLLLRGSSPYGGTDAQWTYRREVDDPLLAGGWFHDILPEGGDPSLYKVVLTPWMPIMTEALVAQMLDWVERGGTWIVGPASALRDECAAVFTDAGMGPLERELGFRTLFWQQADNINGTLGEKELPLKGLAYALEPGACRALGHYTSSYVQGHAWAVEKSVGKGRVVVFAAFAQGRYGDLLEHVLGATTIHRHRTSGLGVFLLPREARDGRRGYVATNTEAVEGWVDAPYAGVDLLTGKSIPSGRIALPSMGVLAVQDSDPSARDTQASPVRVMPCPAATPETLPPIS